MVSCGINGINTTDLPFFVHQPPRIPSLRFFRDWEFHWFLDEDFSPHQSINNLLPFPVENFHFHGIVIQDPGRYLDLRFFPSPYQGGPNFDIQHLPAGQDWFPARTWYCCCFPLRGFPGGCSFLPAVNWFLYLTPFAQEFLNLVSQGSRLFFLARFWGHTRYIIFIF